MCFIDLEILCLLFVLVILWMKLLYLIVIELFLFFELLFGCVIVDGY